MSRYSSILVSRLTKAAFAPTEPFELLAVFKTLLWGAWYMGLRERTDPYSMVLAARFNELFPYELQGCCLGRFALILSVGIFVGFATGRRRLRSFFFMCNFVFWLFLFFAFVFEEGFVPMTILYLSMTLQSAWCFLVLRLET